MSGKGRVFRGKTLKVEKAPEALRELPAQEALDTKPAPMTTAVRAMFAKPTPVIAAPRKAPKVSVPGPKPTSAAVAAPIVPSTVPPSKPKFQFKRSVPVSVAVDEGVSEGKEGDVDEDAAFEDVSEADLKGEWKELAERIQEEERADPYVSVPPPAYVPASRRGFSEFIKQNFEEFMLEANPDDSKMIPGDKYPYQKFVREYMRQASPYRGILVYHGLGSGKTCTAIATSEALYSTANKKIIVMTPFSLRKNFLNEVSLCGFRHFRLQNYWVKLPITDAEARLFATSVLGVSESHLRTASAIWVPDFRKTPEEANYSQLDAAAQTEIRKQILSILVWDPVKNPTGRIRFINYNGISAAKLQEMACKKPHADFFDDAVVIIDEVHNLVRLMQGTIEPYLTRVKGLKRIIAEENVTVEKWKPTLCTSVQPTVQAKNVGNAGATTKLKKKMYMRGYSFYRLLLDAKNTKIVGLSGTPLINFPEELGILMNILHGYIPTVELSFEQTGVKVQKGIQDLALAHPFLDFVRCSQETGTAGTRLLCTLLPYGVRKVSNDEGVERIPSDEPSPSVDEVVKDLVESLKEAGFPIVGSPTVQAVPLLPPFGNEFQDAFLRKSGANLDNKIVLVKRITGLVSYYKGSRADLMPRVKVDEVVRVPFSLYSQRMYTQVREEEVSKEKKKKSTAGELGGVWAEVYEVGTGSQTSNYKMASRQACNFAFPSEVVRPKPSRRDQLAEAGRGDAGGDLVDTAPDGPDPKDAELFPELEDAAQDEDDARSAIAAKEEDEALEAEVFGEEGEEESVTTTLAEAQSGGQPMEADGKEADTEDADDSLVPTLPTGQALEQLSTTTDVVAPAEPTTTRGKFVMKGLLAAKAAQLKADCKVGTKPGEPYATAVERAKECLRTTARDRLKLGVADGLEVYSPKFAEMLRRIEAAPGSSLVYSQFLDMEGIGIFRIAMDVNGYAPIVIEKTAAGPAFSKETIASLKLGPGGQPRYMTFSGGEEEEIRRLALDVFNAKFDQLPQNLKSVLLDAGYTNNHHGEICRVFCITSAGAEGLSLKCVRAVHIMEPYWNDVRLKQVKGRAIRIGSHLELPEAERDVSIYTYLACFPKEAQLAKSGDLRIDETIRNADRIPQGLALEFKLPIQKGAPDYIVTTDERLYMIAERKQAITTALENVMKSAAIDCELNIQQNRDGSFKCLPLKGKVGDFLYHPYLNKDIQESASMYQISEGAVAEQPGAPPAAAPPADFLFQKFKGEIYRMKPLRDALTDEITGFEMYAKDDETMARLLGTAGAKAGKPAPPVKFL